MAYKSNEYDLCWKAPYGSPTRPEEVALLIGAEHNAQTTPQLSRLVDDAWEKKRCAHPQVRLFNGLKFRLAGHSCLRGGSDTANPTPTPTQPKAVELHLGATDYKSFIGTHYAAEQDLAAAIGDGTGDAPDTDPFMSHALGIESLVLTSDGYLILIKRSEKVAEYPGFYCGPGGHAEPGKVLGLSLAEQDSSVTHSGVAGGLLARPADCLQELFGSAVDEVVDELGVERGTLSLRGLIGVARNTRTRGKPDLLFVVSSSQSRSEVEAVYHKGEMNESFESVKLLAVPAGDKPALRRMIAEDELTPPSAAAVEWLADTPQPESLWA